MAKTYCAQNSDELLSEIPGFLPGYGNLVIRKHHDGLIHIRYDGRHPDNGGIDVHSKNLGEGLASVLLQLKQMNLL